MESGDDREVIVTEVEGFVIIKPKIPRITWDNHQSFKEAVSSVEKKGCDAVIMDLCDVEMFDSVGLGCLVAAKMRMKDIGEIRLCKQSDGKSR